MIPAVYKLPITHLETVAADTVELGLNTNGTSFAFTAGQYVKLLLPDLATTNPKDGFREFSIASPPGGRLLTTIFRVSESRFKQQLLGMKPGSVIDVEGPLGVFTLPQTAGRSIVMLAGGVGITPFMSMLRDERYGKYDIHLHYFNSRPDRAAYREELTRVGQQSKRHVFFHSRKLAPTLLRKAAGEDCLYYIAGPPSMVQACRRLLLDYGILKSHIRTEEFTGYA